MLFIFVEVSALLTFNKSSDNLKFSTDLTKKDRQEYHRKRRGNMSNIPTKLLNESHGHEVTLELNTGEMYRGKLIENEDNMNCQLRDVIYTQSNGKTTRMDHVFVRGSNVKFIVVPDILKHAPLFRKTPVSKPPPPIRGPKRR